MYSYLIGGAGFLSLNWGLSQLGMWENVPAALAINIGVVLMASGAALAIRR